MNAKSSAAEGWVPPADKTSQTDDERIKNVTPLPPPEHLIRFFPIRGTPVETLVAHTRKAIRKIVHGIGVHAVFSGGLDLLTGGHGGGGGIRHGIDGERRSRSRLAHKGQR